MKNKLSDLNNHLFVQLERLNDEDLTEEQVQKEISRARAITEVANSIISNAKVVLEASKFIEESLNSTQAVEEPLKLLGLKNEN